MGPAFEESLWGIKYFQDFKKANFRQKIESVKHPSLDTIKWKEYQMDPIQVLLSQSPLGGYNIFKISKRPHVSPDFESVKTVSQTQ